MPQRRRSRLWCVASGRILCCAENRNLSVVNHYVSNLPKPRRASTNNELLRVSFSVLFCIVATDHHCFKSHLVGREIETTDSDKPHSSEKTVTFSKHTHNNSTDSRHLHITRIPPTSTPRPLSPVVPVGLGILTPSRSLCHISRSGTALPRRSSHSRTNSLTSISMVGVTGSPTLSRPAPVATIDSAWRAIHPPTHHFRHVSSPSRQTATSIRQVPPSPHIGVHRFPSALYSASASHSRSGSFVPLPVLPSGAQPPWLKFLISSSESSNCSRCGGTTLTTISSRPSHTQRPSDSPATNSLDCCSSSCCGTEVVEIQCPKAVRRKPVQKGVIDEIELTIRLERELARSSRSREALNRDREARERWECQKAETKRLEVKKVRSDGSLTRGVKVPGAWPEKRELGYRDFTR
jgi:hypothetical protein